MYIVPTPIGNLGDISLRAIETLKSVDIIACEDTRTTQKLLNHFDIKTKCLSYHKFNEKERSGALLGLLGEGKKIALVSDAGTPLICDPGAVLVGELQKAGVKITALPGANAIVTFLSQVARAGEDFFFAGFLPRTPAGIEKLAAKYTGTDLVFYESPNRLIKTLELLGDRQVAVGRELTKVFEEVKVGTGTELAQFYLENVLKGEVVAMVFRDTARQPVDEKVSLLKAKGFSAKDISVIVSELYGANKNEIYKKICRL